LNTKTLRKHALHPWNHRLSISSPPSVRVSSKSITGRLFSDDKTVQTDTNHTTSLRIRDEKDNVKGVSYEENGCFFLVSFLPRTILLIQVPIEPIGFRRECFTDLKRFDHYSCGGGRLKAVVSSDKDGKIFSRGLFFQPEFAALRLYIDPPNS
jgi:hypothetical protein